MLSIISKDIINNLLIVVVNIATRWMLYSEFSDRELIQFYLVVDILNTSLRIGAGKKDTWQLYSVKAEQNIIRLSFSDVIYLIVAYIIYIALLNLNDIDHVSAGLISLPIIFYSLEILQIAVYSFGFHTRFRFIQTTAPGLILIYLVYHSLSITKLVFEMFIFVYVAAYLAAAILALFLIRRDIKLKFVSSISGSYWNDIVSNGYFGLLYFLHGLLIVLPGMVFSNLLGVTSNLSLYFTWLRPLFSSLNSLFIFPFNRYINKKMLFDKESLLDARTSELFRNLYGVLIIVCLIVGCLSLIYRESVVWVAILVAAIIGSCTAICGGLLGPSEAALKLASYRFPLLTIRVSAVAIVCLSSYLSAKSLPDTIYLPMYSTYLGYLFLAFFFNRTVNSLSLNNVHRM